MTVVSADRTADLNDELFNIYRVETVPYHIILDGKEYRDSIDITLPEVYAAYEDHKSLPKTSAVNVEEYLEHFKKLKTEYGDDEEIIHITLGSSLTSSYQNCCIAAEELGGVYVVDSCTLSSATGLMVIDACEMAQKGATALEIKTHLESRIQCYHASFVLYTLEYLKAGGRCSTLAALASAALSIKPSIVVDGFNNGAMTVGKKYRGKFEKVVSQYVHDKLAQYDDIDYSKIFVTNTGVDAGFDQRALMREIIEKETPFEKIYETTCSCTIGAHCGPGCCGILFETFSNCV